VFLNKIGRDFERHTGKATQMKFKQ